jgi:membrane associated rhomboid family serine protease
VLKGEIWRLLTAAWLHGSPSHLILNMLSLHALGPITEWTCGRARFAAIYLGAAFAGNVASFWGEPVPSLGASGAIFGLAGALVVYFSRNHKLFGSRFDGLLIRLIGIIVLNLVTGHFMPQIDEAGHLGGLLGGAALAYLFGPKFELCLVKGRSGVWLLDEAPLQLLATPPRQVL